MKPPRSPERVRRRRREFAAALLAADQVPERVQRLYLRLLRQRAQRREEHWHD